MVQATCGRELLNEVCCMNVRSGGSKQRLWGHGGQITIDNGLVVKTVVFREASTWEFVAQSSRSWGEKLSE